MKENFEQIDALNTQVLAVSTDDLSKASYIAENLELPFPILYDPPAEVVKQYGVFNLLGDGLATPSIFIIDKNGVIRWKFIAERYYDRPDPKEIINQLEVVES